MTRTIDETLRDRTPELMAIPGVVGTGIGEESGRAVILVLVARITPGLEGRVPRALDGHPVVVREVGDVRRSGGG
ncbi:MAG: hypothetical protein ACM3JJ_05510 [Hyphomicrobiales bacterium]